ncbi:MAG: hypothetical protein L0220_22420, partial [Acidobacteria bacterium]|nr:hypothetical protein [Acidobacteriota bacterium]
MIYLPMIVKGRSSPPEEQSNRKPETKSEPNLKQAVPFFGVSNIEVSVGYYVDGLGFVMTRKWIDDGKLRWCYLERGGAALMLQEFWKEGQHANVPRE